MQQHQIKKSLGFICFLTALPATALYATSLQLQGMVDGEQATINCSDIGDSIQLASGNLQITCVTEITGVPGSGLPPTDPEDPPVDPEDPPVDPEDPPVDPELPVECDPTVEPVTTVDWQFGRTNPIPLSGTRVAAIKINGAQAAAPNSGQILLAGAVGDSLRTSQMVLSQCPGSFEMPTGLTEAEASNWDRKCNVSGTAYRIDWRNGTSTRYVCGVDTTKTYYVNVRYTEPGTEDFSPRPSTCPAGEICRFTLTGNVIN